MVAQGDNAGADNNQEDGGGGSDDTPSRQATAAYVTHVLSRSRAHVVSRCAPGGILGTWRLRTERSPSRLISDWQPLSRALRRVGPGASPTSQPSEQTVGGNRRPEATSLLSRVERRHRHLHSGLPDGGRAVIIDLELDLVRHESAGSVVPC